MKTIATLAILLACAVATPLCAQEEITVRGEVVDLSCYLSKGSKGPEHRACAALCAKKGLPIGLLTEGGEVYLLVDNHDNPDPYDALKKIAGENAEVKGRKFSRGGVTAIQVLESRPQ